MAWDDYFTGEPDIGTSYAPAPRWVEPDLLEEGTDLPPMVAAPAQGLYESVPRVRVAQPRKLAPVVMAAAERPWDYGMAPGESGFGMGWSKEGRLEPLSATAGLSLEEIEARRPTSKQEALPPPAASPRARELSFAELTRGLPLHQGGGGYSVSRVSSAIDPKEAMLLRARSGIATEKEQQAVGQRSILEATRLRDVAAEQKSLNTKLEANYKEMMARQAVVDAEVAKQMDANRTTLDEIRNTRVDPDRIYKGEGGGLTRVFHAIGIALGSFGASLNKSNQNLALDIVNKAIDRDVAAQTAELTNKRYVYEAGRNIVADLYRKSGSIEKAYLMAKMHTTEVAKNAIDAVTSKSQSEQAFYNGEQVKAQLEQQQIGLETRLAQLERERVTRTVRGGGGSMTPAANMAAQLVIAQRAAAAGMGGQTKAEEQKNDTTPKKDVSMGLAGIATLKRLDKLDRMLVGMGGSSAIPLGEATRRYNIELGPLVDQYVYSVTGAAAPAAAIKKYEGRLPKGIDPTRIGLFGERNLAEQRAKIAALRREIGAKVKVLAPGSTALRDALKREGLSLEALGR